MSTQLDRVLQQTGEAPVDAVEIVNEVRKFLARFCVFPSEHALVAVTLWVIHAHMIEHFYTTPRLLLLSPEPGSGKTRVLEIISLLVPQPMFALSASAASIFRTLDERQVTLLFDEVDAIWNRRGKDDHHEDLRALLNAGYKRGATIPRCVGPRHDVVQFKVYCAVALAGLGDVPETIMSRAVIIRMRRRRPGEHVEPFRSRRDEPLGHALRNRLEKWCAGVAESVGAAEPEMPEGVVDRPAEIWEPLIAVADRVGGDWPRLAREACLALSRAADDRPLSLGIRLLTDLRIIFANAEQLYTDTIIERLTTCYGDMEPDAPWSDMRGKQLDARRLASILKSYGVKSIKVRVDGGKPLQGYRREDLKDAWERYLPPMVSAEAEHPEHPEQPRVEASSVVPNSGQEVPPVDSEPEHGTPVTAGPVPDVPHVPAFRTSERACTCRSGCDECGEWKTADGTPLSEGVPDVPF